MITAKIKIVFWFKTGTAQWRNITGNTEEIKNLYHSLSNDHIHWLYRKDCVRNDPSIGIQMYLSEIFMNLLKQYGVITDFHTDFSQKGIEQEYHSIPSFSKTYVSNKYTIYAKFQKQGNFYIVYTISTGIQDINTFKSQFLQIANQIESQFKELFKNEYSINYVYYKTKFNQISDGWLEPASLLLKIAPDKFLIDEFDFKHLEVLEWQGQPGGGNGGGGGNGTQPPPQQPQPEPPEEDFLKKYGLYILLGIIILILLLRR